MFRLFDVVRLARDVENVPALSIGIIMAVYISEKRIGYEVEFRLETGSKVLTLSADEIEISQAMEDG